MQPTTLGELLVACGAGSYASYPVADGQSPFQHTLALDGEGDLWIEVGSGEGDGNEGDEQAKGDDGNDDYESAAGGGDSDDDFGSYRETEWRGGHHHRQRPSVCRFRVCSRAMRRASPVWKAMLSGPWQERKPEPAADGTPVEWVVALPDDHPVGIAVVLAVIHGRLDLVPTWPNRIRREHEAMSAILSAADKYDVVQLFWPFISEWLPHAQQPYYTGGEGDDNHAETLHRLNIAWQLGATELVENTVRRFILELSEARLEGLLAAAEEGPRIGLSLSLREVLAAVTSSRSAAIQSVLDFFRRLVKDRNYEPAAGCRKALFGAVDTAAIEAGTATAPCFRNSAVVAALQKRHELERRRCNALVLYQIWGRVHDGWEEMPREASDVYTSVNDLTDMVGHTLGVFSSPDPVLLSGHEECNQSVHTQFRDFRAKLERRWERWEPVLEPEQTSWLKKRGDMLGTSRVVHQCDLYY